MALWLRISRAMINSVGETKVVASNGVNAERVLEPKPPASQLWHEKGNTHRRWDTAGPPKI